MIKNVANWFVFFIIFMIIFFVFFAWVHTIVYFLVDGPIVAGLGILAAPIAAAFSFQIMKEYK